MDKIATLAIDILNLSRNTLVINFRFMDKAISMFKYQSIDSLNGMAVDGRNIYYDPLYLLKKFSKDKKRLTRQYLHMVLHCVYKHFWVGNIINQDYWNLACDIAVEYTINDFNTEILNLENSREQISEAYRLSKEVKYMTADMLYEYFLTEELSNEEIERLQKLFCMDTHDNWYSMQKWEDIYSAFDLKNKNTDSFNMSKEEFDAISREWEEVAKQMRMNLETFSRDRGSRGLDQNLIAVTREKYDYSAFLKNFAVLGECMKINQDEFDYIFYTYGLQLYERMPLIEPLEYKDKKQVREIVIAIDTSGSTSGELVQKFLQKTYNVLKTEESFFTRFNLHIIQCDTEIQEDVKITNQTELDDYIGSMRIKGRGGTDFRPVFKYVDELIRNKEFSNLKGLIYFTDGYGIFPERPPLYNAAFVFLDEGFEQPKVPAWAIKLVLQPEEIEEM
jgi:hypothetical protein